MAETYRLTWEMVERGELYRFCNADPTFHSDVKQTVPNSEIPDEYWYPLEKITGDPWQQYASLRRWAEADVEFVRQVRLYKAEIVDLVWREVSHQTSEGARDE